jgi:hypothetical protein
MTRRARRYEASRLCSICHRQLGAGRLIAVAGTSIRHASCAARLRHEALQPTERVTSTGPGIRLVVTGGRAYADYPRLANALDRVRYTYGISVLGHGAASGADCLAARWAKYRAVPVRAFAADWDQFGTRAGPIRNRLLLDAMAAQLLVAFPGSMGTEDCTLAARERGIPVWEPTGRKPIPAPLMDSLSG